MLQMLSSIEVPGALADTPRQTLRPSGVRTKTANETAAAGGGAPLPAPSLDLLPPPASMQCNLLAHKNVLGPKHTCTHGSAAAGASRQRSAIQQVTYKQSNGRCRNFNKAKQRSKDVLYLVPVLRLTHELSANALHLLFFLHDRLFLY
jgi:hypothetical protein